MNTDHQPGEDLPPSPSIQNELTRTITHSAGLLAVFAAVGTAALALTYSGTQSQIEANARAALVRSLQQLVPADRYDNDMAMDTLQLSEPSLGNSPVTVYRARKGGQPVAAVVTTVAPDGYAGNIALLVGVNADGQLAGVRVVTHKETPGLGDKIDVDRNDWITRFTGKSLTNPSLDRWKVKKDGGAFDQFSGATITPRAVVGAVKRTLQYFEGHREALFASPG